MHPSNLSTREARAFAAYLREPIVSRWGINVPTNNKSTQSQYLSAASIAAYSRTVKVFFNWLERENYIGISPFNKSVKFSNRNKQDHIIKNVSIEDIKRNFEALTDSNMSQPACKIPKQASWFVLNGLFVTIHAKQAYN